jgi:hypothetical protein
MGRRWEGAEEKRERDGRLEDGEGLRQRPSKRRKIEEQTGTTADLRRKGKWV